MNYYISAAGAARVFSILVLYVMSVARVYRLLQSTNVRTIRCWMAGTSNLLKGQTRQKETKAHQEMRYPDMT